MNEPSDNPYAPLPPHVLNEERLKDIPSGSLVPARDWRRPAATSSGEKEDQVILEWQQKEEQLRQISHRGTIGTVLAIVALLPATYIAAVAASDTAFHGQGGEDIGPAINAIFMYCGGMVTAVILLISVTLNIAALSAAASSNGMVRRTYPGVAGLIIGLITFALLIFVAVRFSYH